jgi:hypothetical protein
VTSKLTSVNYEVYRWTTEVAALPQVPSLKKHFEDLPEMWGCARYTAGFEFLFHKLTTACGTRVAGRKSSRHPTRSTGAAFPAKLLLYKTAVLVQEVQRVVPVIDVINAVVIWCDGEAK